MALQTCPKCGKQFYGVACPDCAYPHPAPTASEVRMQRLVQTRVWALAVGLLLALLSLGFFYATFSQSHQWSGGIPFFPPSWNDKLGRVLSGFFACLCAYMASCSFYQAVKPKAKK